LGELLISALVLATLIAAVAAWHAWEFHLRPLAIPKAEIVATADRLIAEHGPRAEEMAYSEEDRAWQESNTYEQGRWRRVRRELWRRYERGEWE
jgi:hypothetical protein